MRVRKRDKDNLVKVGIFVAGLTLILMVIIASIGKETSLFEPKVTISAKVPNVSNLKTGSYVELKGIRVGSVSGIRIVSEEEVEILMTILEESLKWIRVDSKVSISTAGLVGDKYVEIHGGSKEADKFEPGKDILVSERITDFKTIMTKGESITEVTERILKRIDNITTKLDQDQLLVESVKSINKASKNLEDVTGELKAAQLGQMVKNMNRVSSTMDRVLTRVEKGPGTAHSLIYEDTVHDDLRALLGGAQRSKVIKYFIRESIKKSEQRKSQED